MTFEIRALREDEYEVHDRLIYESYKEFEHERLGIGECGWWLTHINRDPYYSPEQSRVLLVDGEMVASVSAYQRQMHCAGRLAKVGAIGSVATHPDHRRRGYVRQLMAECREWMESEGFDFCFLFGRQEVYDGSGYEMFSAFETIASVRPPTADTGLTFHPANFETDVPALCALYDQFCSPLTGPFVRTRDYWERRVPGGYFRDYAPNYSLIREGEKAVGYMRCDSEGSVAELGWLRDDPDLPARVVAAVVGLWPHLSEVRFGLCTSELIAALDPLIWAPTAAAYGRRQSALQLVECSKGLWTYIGPGAGLFPEVTDTAGLLRFLRQHEYCFWRGPDSF